MGKRYDVLRYMGKRGDNTNGRKLRKKTEEQPKCATLGKGEIKIGV